MKYAILILGALIFLVGCSADVTEETSTSALLVDRCLGTPDIQCVSATLDNNVLTAQLEGLEGAQNTNIRTEHNGQVTTCTGTSTVECIFEDASSGRFDMAIEYTPQGSNLPRTGRVDMFFAR